MPWRAPRLLAVSRKSKSCEDSYLHIASCLCSRYYFIALVVRYLRRRSFKHFSAECTITWRSQTEKAIGISLSFCFTHLIRQFCEEPGSNYQPLSRPVNTLASRFVHLPSQIPPWSRKTEHYRDRFRYNCPSSQSPGLLDAT